MNNKSNQKVFSIPIFVVVFIIIIVTSLSFKVYALYFKPNPKESNSDGKSNNVSINNMLLNTNTNLVNERNVNSNNEENTNITLDSISTDNNTLPSNSTKSIDESHSNKSNETTTEILPKESENKKTSKKSSQVQSYMYSNGKKYDTIGVLKIPSLNIEYPILSNTSDKLLKISLTKYWGGNPNEVGNLCILGHNYKNSKFFGKLPKIKKNATIELTDTSGRTLNYKVYKTDIIDPDDTSCTSQLTDGNIEITLITCYYEKGNAHATKRFVVKARSY